MYYTDFSIEMAVTEMLDKAMKDNTPRKYARLLLEGAEIIKQLEKERDEARAKEQKWIPVDERTPQDEQEVVVYYQHRYASGGVHPFTWRALRGFGYAPNGFPFDVTHWMPLPEPPKEDRNAEEAST